VLTIDGSQGEGGGQILRTALSLALVTGTPCRIENIRAGREKPGLLRQHLTAVNAAVAISAAEVEGAAADSTTVVFRPGSIKPGDYHFAVGTAGSTGLVLQTVLPPLLTAAGPSTITVEGGTHNPSAPPFDFLARALLPLIERMGARVEARLDRPGFYPAGGGQCTVSIMPAPSLRPIALLERGPVVRRRARALVAQISPRIADRELAVVRNLLGWSDDELETTVIENDARGPGNALLLEIESEQVTEVFTGFGEYGVRAEAVADRVVQHVRRYLAAGVPVGPHLADQLMIPLALAKGGAFRTLALSSHARTNVRVIGAFLGVPFTTTGDRDDLVVSVGSQT
jgi:RNA 3'-terminal phosphate cyclase (ATP)